MKSLFADRKLWFAIAVLSLNAAGWWWVKSEAGGRRPEVGGRRAEVGKGVAPAPVRALKPLMVCEVGQAGLSPDRRLTLSLSFTGPVDWPSLAERLTVVAGGQALPWQFVGKARSSYCLVRTDGAVPVESVEVRVGAGVKPASPSYAELAVPVAQPVELVPEFRFSGLAAATPAFGQPYVVARFTQSAEVKDAAAQIACEPPVALTVTPEPWNDGLRLTGPFVIGQTYVLTFNPELRSRAGHRLAREARRTVVIQHREPSVVLPLEGRYLAPEGDLLVPVMAVNVPHVESRLARVLPQNLVQYAMREGGHYSGWWRDDAASLAEELTASPEVRTNKIAAARNQEQRLLLRLRDYGPEPVRGAYLLQVGAPDVEAQSRLVCVTDLGLSARSDDEAVTVWVTSLRAGRPAPGVRVELYGRNNLLWSKGVSDAQGLVRLARRAGEGEPFLLLAQSADGGDLSVLQLGDRSEVEQRVEASRGYPERGVCEAFVMCDRDLYRHGERAFVQALLRRADGAPPAPFPATLHLVKPDGRTFKSYPVMPDALGAVTAEVTLPEYLPSGTYTLELRLPGDGAVLGERKIMLEAFVPPQTRVKLSALPAAVRAGDDVSFQVSAEHLFGKPAAGLAADARIVLTPAEFKPKAWDGYLFGDAERSVASQALECPRQALDAAGAASFAMKVEVRGQPAARLRAQVEATVTETGGRTVAARAESAVDPYPFYIGVAAGDGGGVRVGVPRTVKLALVGPDGARRTERTPLQARLEKVTWVSGMLKEASGGYRWESERLKTPVSEAQVEAGPEEAAHTFTVQGAGEYVLTFTDPATQAATSWHFTSSDDGQAQGAWSRESPDRVELVFDKEAYRPGETARVQARVPFAGEAWVTLSSDRVLESRVLAVTNNTLTLDWAVAEAHAPSVAVSVTVVRPAVAESVWSAHRASGEAVLRVLPPERKLAVRVAPDSAVWRPKAKGAVRVSVSDSAGRPAAGAAVTVMAVDEGVCLLTDYETPDPYAYFTEARWGYLSFHDVYRSLMPVTDERAFGGASHVGGDGGDELFKRLNPVAARRFKPVSLWQADLKTGADGEARAEFELPEFAGELRLMAVAWDARAVGSEAASVKVKRRLVVQPELPRFLAPGDQAFAEVALHNESGAACSARVAVRAEGPLACDWAARDVALAAGASQVLSVPVAAQERAGAARLCVRVEGAGERYEDAVEIAVRPAAALQVTDELFTLQPGEAREFAPPQGVLPASVRQTFFCSAQPAVNLLGALEYVTHYPYGCLEQTVSSALPLLALSGLEARLPQGESTLALEARDRVNAALLRVLSMRRCGGFSMWPDVWDCHPQGTVYAALFLAQAAQAGYALPDDALDEVAQALRDRLTRSDEGVSRAYVCHVLALAGRPEHGWALRLYEQADELDPEARFHLARALLRGGDAEKGRELLARTPAVSGLREAAFALLAWLEAEPASPQVAACCREIEAARRGEGHWGSTQDNALALLALGAYLRVTPERPQVFAPAFAWPGGERAAGATNAFVWAAPDAEAAGGALRVRNAGPGPLYGARRVARVPLAASVKEGDSGLRVRRVWLDAQGRPVDPASLRRGDLVIVGLTLDPLGRELKDVVIEELLPAGLEIENADAADAGTLPWLKRDEAEWVLHREARDDRLLIFAKPVGRAQTLHYAARAVSAGAFVAPPASAACMYDPDVFSRHGLSRVTVR